ncbi:UNVERIFIED_CONTAM: hypothetical protein K2H54_049179, partial [Gekko kuhli]
MEYGASPKPQLSSRANAFSIAALMSSGSSKAKEGPHDTIKPLGPWNCGRSWLLGHPALWSKEKAGLQTRILEKTQNRQLAQPVERPNRASSHSLQSLPHKKPEPVERRAKAAEADGAVLGQPSEEGRGRFSQPPPRGAVM